MELIEYCYLEKDEIVNHERWNNTVFDQDFRTFKLFWTSPGKSSYYKNNNLMYLFKLKIKLKGIKIISPNTPSDLEDILHDKISTNHDLANISDAFKNMWYAILEDNILGGILGGVDFINIDDRELIFSTKNLPYLSLFG